ncbi:hypothetical protein BJ138DRAFT_1183191 [Hygrophoropsis aurantiaca]|uniref:Uncharacterized protein n=1 Tax=Hygrophoropsis aurantiaca TaxID=72124 RepID=A0ACB7ZZY2_9AGAM|nr:hypothetical protein BJ138DRAFT_1183191 [Hygrophoropsis aurantiaca]
MSAKHSHAYSPVAQDVAQSTTQSQTRSGQLDSSWTWTALHSRWTAAKSRTLTFCDANAGMLLIMSAQLFFAFMNLSVKILNSLDEPVPTLEPSASFDTPTLFLAYVYTRITVGFDSDDLSRPTRTPSPQFRMGTVLLHYGHSHILELLI